MFKEPPIPTEDQRPAFLCSAPIPSPMNKITAGGNSPSIGSAEVGDALPLQKKNKNPKQVKIALERDFMI
jgi:hypothetical protein